MDMDSLLGNRISPILETEGFKRKGRRFLRRMGGFEHVVDISKGRGMMQGKFAVSFGAHPMVEGFPGLPALPLRSGDHWLTYRLAPPGLDDRWWWIDRLYPDDVEEIGNLLTKGLGEWFSPLMSLEAFSENWYRQVFIIAFASKRYGPSAARLAYLHAAVFASLGQTGTALKVAETARSLAGPHATTFVGWIQELDAVLRSK